MWYCLDFDIAAICIYVILLTFYYQRKHLPILQNTFFSIVTWNSLLVTLFDIGSAVLSSLSEETRMQTPGWVFWFINQGYYLTNSTITPLFCMYAATIVDFFEIASKKAVRIFRLSLMTPYVINLMIIFLTPILKDIIPLIYTISSDHLYVRGGFCFFLQYFLAVYYIIFAFCMIYVYRRVIKNRNKVIILTFVILAVAGAIIQLLNSQLLVQCFAISISALVFSYNIEKSEEFVDSVSGLYNQTAFSLLTKRMLLNKEKLTVVGVIIDDIFFLSTTYGQEHLDKVNNSIGSFLKTEFQDALTYHLSQGQYCLVFHETDPRKIEKAVFQIRTRFHQQWSADDARMLLYCRLCVISCPSDAQTSAEIEDIFHLVANDERYKSALIYAKNIDIEYRRRTITLEHVLKNALSENKFEVFYQPIYSTTKKRLIGAEALIRLRDDDGNFISPEEFIPIAEKTGVILRAGEFVFDTVCRMLAQINLERYGIEKLDVNLSVTQCMQEILAEQILSIQAIYQVPSSVLNLEITETASAYTPDILLRNMQRLAAHGIELSLDDYGSGYSNMNYLLNLPFKMIKLDKELVWKAFSNNKASIALASTIQMIKALGMSVLAEGIETGEQADWLTRLGCDYFQGFYFGRPLPKDDFLELMKLNTAEWYRINGLEFSDQALAESSSFEADIIDLESLDGLEELDESGAVIKKAAPQVTGKNPETRHDQEADDVLELEEL